MSSSSSRRDKRIQEEMTGLIKKGFQVKLTDEDRLDRLEVVFHGPKESPYEDGVWKIIVDFPPRYPSKPPSLTFANKIFHPNITDELGSVCVNLLDEQYWNPSDSLVAIFDEFIPQLLREPNPEDPNNHDAAALLLASKEKFEQRVREHCAEYAKMQDKKSESSSGDEGSRSSQDQTPGHANP